MIIMKSVSSDAFNGCKECHSFPSANIHSTHTLGELCSIRTFILYVGLSCGGTLCAAVAHLPSNATGCYGPPSSYKQFWVVG